MNEHLSPDILNALADGELSPADLEAVQRHLAECPACTSRALAASLVKSAAARFGRRYAAPANLAAKITGAPSAVATPPPVRPNHRPLWFGAAALLILGLAAANLIALKRSDAAQATEALDQHIATLAANAPPQVVSSDRHTVKPWFQGKLPFSFNLPTNLPPDVTLDGANLTYLHGEPTAQLLYSIGKHHASLFVQQTTGSTPRQTQAGFTVTSFTSPTLTVLAVSDVDPTRLADLLDRFRQAQP
jgi:anti-sigma factor RsiW